MKLIPEWRSAWRLFSVQVAALAVAWVALPTDTQGAILRLLGIDASKLTAVLGVLVLAARLIAQPAVKELTDDNRTNNPR